MTADGVTVVDTELVHVVMLVVWNALTVWSSEAIGKGKRLPVCSCGSLVGVVAIAGGD